MENNQTPLLRRMYYITTAQYIGLRKLQLVDTSLNMSLIVRRALSDYMDGPCLPVFEIEARFPLKLQGLYLDEPLYLQLKQFASIHNKKDAYIIRRAIDAYLSKHLKSI